MPYKAPPNNLVQNSPEYLRDYEHAAFVFRPGQYSNSPRKKFLYHVYFTLNIEQIPGLASLGISSEWPVISLLVKTIQLPKFSVETDTLNQYNRKRIVQTKVKYDPIDVEFHDDCGDRVRQMWYEYFTYYYKDSTHRYGNSNSRNGTNGNSATASNGFNYNNRDIYDGDWLESDWGYVGESYKDGVLQGTKPPFFRDIRVYGFDHSRFAEYVLINPIISSWQHDSYDYAQDDGVMNNSVQIEYEAVKYYKGKLGKNGLPNPVLGFPNPFYYGDTQSTLAGGNWESDLTPGYQEDLQAGGFMNPVGAPQQASNANDRRRRPNNPTRSDLRNTAPVLPPGGNRSSPNQVGSLSPNIPVAEAEPVVNTPRRADF